MDLSVRSPSQARHGTRLNLVTQRQAREEHGLTMAVGTHGPVCARRTRIRSSLGKRSRRRDLIIIRRGCFPYRRKTRRIIPFLNPLNNFKMLYSIRVSGERMTCLHQNGPSSDTKSPLLSRMRNGVPIERWLFYSAGRRCRACNHA